MALVIEMVKVMKPTCLGARKDRICGNVERVGIVMAMTMVGGLILEIC